MSLGYGMFDADNHLYEAQDAFTRHLPELRKRDVYWVTTERGHKKLVVDRKIYDYIPNPTFDPVAVAGALDRKMVEPLATHPEYQNRDARIHTFDQQEIEAAVLFPTLTNGLYELIGDNIPLSLDVIWAYDRWLDDDWGFAYQDRIFAAPIVPLGDPDGAVALVEWAIERGARAVNVSAAPALTAVGYRSPGDPMFDGVWARCAEAHLLVCAHAGSNGYNRYSGDITGHHEQRPFEDHRLDVVINQGRAISDFFAGMIGLGVFARFPELRLASVENRSEWAPQLLRVLERMYRPGDLVEHPADTFRRCVWVTPHWEDDLDGLVDALGAEHVLAGSDWPHYDSLADPTSFAKYLDDFDAGVVRLIMRENLRSLLVA